MKCPKCHTEIKEGSAFCKSCGVRLKDSLPENKIEAINFTKSDDQRFWSPIRILWLSLIAIVIVGVTVSVVIFNNNQSHKMATVMSSSSSTIVYSSRLNEYENSNATNSKNSSSIKYSTSANTVNGGQGIYDGDSYYICGTTLKKTDKNDKTTVLLNEKVYYLTSNNEYLFFKSVQDPGIYKMKKDGTEKTKIYSGNIHELTFYNNKLYFCTEEGNSASITSMSMDGTNVTKLYDCNEWYMSIYNDKIYFTEYSSNRELKVMNLDGSNVQTLHNGSCYDLCIADDVLYFSEGDDTRYMYKMELDTQKITLIRQKYTRSTNFYDDKLYFIDTSKNILCCNLDGSNEKTICTSGNATYINMLPSKLCYNTSNGDLIEISLTK